jgi:hypothetical protein
MSKRGNPVKAWYPSGSDIMGQKDMMPLLKAYIEHTNTDSFYAREGDELLAELGRFVINFQYLESIMNRIIQAMFGMDDRTNLVLMDEINIMHKTNKICKLLKLRIGHSKFFNDLFNMTRQLIEERNFIVHSEIFGDTEYLNFDNFPKGLKKFEAERRRYDLDSLEELNSEIRDLISLYTMVYMDILPDEEIPFHADYDELYRLAHEAIKK